MFRKHHFESLLIFKCSFSLISCSRRIYYAHKRREPELSIFKRTVKRFMSVHLGHALPCQPLISNIKSWSDCAS